MVPSGADPRLQARALALNSDRLYEELKPPLSTEEARIEADRCLECGGAHAPAPCALACPADIDVPGFVGAIARGEDRRAAELIGLASLGKLQQRKDMTAIAAAHHIPYVAQTAAGPHWQDRSVKAARAARADGRRF